jgi:hypothetical protein
VLNSSFANSTLSKLNYLYLPTQYPINRGWTNTFDKNEKKITIYGYDHRPEWFSNNFFPQAKYEETP